jgi:hypothetical protein
VFAGEVFRVPAAAGRRYLYGFRKNLESVPSTSCGCAFTAWVRRFLGRDGFARERSVAVWKPVNSRFAGTTPTEDRSRSSEWGLLRKSLLLAPESSACGPFFFLVQRLNTAASQRSVTGVPVPSRHEDIVVDIACRRRLELDSYPYPMLYKGMQLALLLLSARFGILVCRACRCCAADRPSPHRLRIARKLP